MYLFVYFVFLGMQLMDNLKTQHTYQYTKDNLKTRLHIKCVTITSIIVVVVERFSRLQRAKQTLSDPALREQYDTWRRSGIAIPYDTWCAKRNVHTVSVHPSLI